MLTPILINLPSQVTVMTFAEKIMRLFNYLMTYIVCNFKNTRFNILPHSRALTWSCKHF